MKPSFTAEYLEEAHTHTFTNGPEIKRSSTCTCFYCGHQFPPQEAAPEDWWDEGPSRNKTLACPMCGIDAVLGDASGFPVTDPDFIRACSEDWFSGYSRISDGLEPEEVKYEIIEVE